MFNDKKMTILTISAILILIIIAVIYFKKNTNNMKNCKYFKQSEFDSPDEKGSGKRMQKSTIEMLCKAREIANVPFIINSGVRTPEHNKAVKGVSNSAHLGGWAVDIATPDGQNQVEILKALRNAGFKRFGVYKNFIHVDNDPFKNQLTAWGDMRHINNPFKLA